MHTSDEDRRFVADRVMGRCEVLVVRSGDEPVGFLALAGDTVEHLYVRNEGALAFYAHHGFAELKRTDGARNEEREPDVLLWWKGA
ncbi:MAG: hypothetical protein ACRDSN_04670 [Pseudonocardiaceae bacterium]